MVMEWLTVVPPNEFGMFPYSSFCGGQDSKCRLEVMHEKAQITDSMDILRLPETHSLRQIQVDRDVPSPRSLLSMRMFVLSLSLLLGVKGGFPPGV